jgi:hypothetical protein
LNEAIWDLIAQEEEDIVSVINQIGLFGAKFFNSSWVAGWFVHEIGSFCMKTVATVL